MLVSLFTFGMASAGTRAVLMAMPLLVWWCICPRTTRVAKLVAILSYAAAIGLTWVLARRAFSPALILGFAGAYGYFLLLSLVAYAVAPHARRRLTPLGLFVAVAGACMAAPALVLSGLPGLVMQVIGFELALSIYSYCASREPQSRDKHSLAALEDCLFFLLVNPTVVYQRRGRAVGPPGLHRTGLRRCAAGLVLSASVTVIAKLLPALPAYSLAPSWADVSTPPHYAWFAAAHLTGGFVLYWGHSARASFQIGLMRLAGYEVPERYNHPYLAEGAADFWRRWNTYLGDWFKLMVYVPLARWVARNAGAGAGGMARLAVLPAFVACGLLHAASEYADGHGWDLATCVVLCLNGVAVLVWGAANRLRGSLFRRLGLRQAGWPGHVWHTVSALGLWQWMAVSHALLDSWVMPW